ncbi:hypothetical protein ACOMHN_036559 [Nucella lapillus]
MVRSNTGGSSGEQVHYHSLTARHRGPITTWRGSPSLPKHSQTNQHGTSLSAQLLLTQLSANHTVHESPSLYHLSVHCQRSARPLPVPVQPNGLASTPQVGRRWLGKLGVWSVSVSIRLWLCVVIVLASSLLVPHQSSPRKGMTALS